MFEKNIDLSYDEIKKFEAFETCNTIKIARFQFNSVKMYKKTQNLTNSFFDKRTTKCKITILEFQLIFFLNNMSDAIWNVFFSTTKTTSFKRKLNKLFWTVKLKNAKFSEITKLKNIINFFWINKVLKCFFWMIERKVLKCFFWTIKREMLKWFFQTIERNVFS